MLSASGSPQLIVKYCRRRTGKVVYQRLWDDERRAFLLCLGQTNPETEQLLVANGALQGIAPKGIRCSTAWIWTLPEMWKPYGHEIMTFDKELVRSIEQSRELHGTLEYVQSPNGNWRGSWPLGR
jgi:hypothetical protein